MNSTRLLSWLGGVSENQIESEIRTFLDTTINSGWETKSTRERIRDVYNSTREPQGIFSGIRSLAKRRCIQLVLNRVQSKEKSILLPKIAAQLDRTLSHKNNITILQNSEYKVFKKEELNLLVYLHLNNRPMAGNFRTVKEGIKHLRHVELDKLGLLEDFSNLASMNKQQLNKILSNTSSRQKLFNVVVKLRSNPELFAGMKQSLQLRLMQLSQSDEFKAYFQALPESDKKLFLFPQLKAAIRDIDNQFFPNTQQEFVKRLQAIEILNLYTKDELDLFVYMHLQRTVLPASAKSWGEMKKAALSVSKPTAQFLQVLSSSNESQLTDILKALTGDHPEENYNDNEKDRILNIMLLVFSQPHLFSTLKPSVQAFFLNLDKAFINDPALRQKNDLLFELQGSHLKDLIPFVLRDPSELDVLFKQLPTLPKPMQAIIFGAALQFQLEPELLKRVSPALQSFIQKVAGSPEFMTYFKVSEDNQTSVKQFLQTLGESYVNERVHSHRTSHINTAIERDAKNGGSNYVNIVFHHQDGSEVALNLSSLDKFIEQIQKLQKGRAFSTIVQRFFTQYTWDRVIEACTEAVKEQFGNTSVKIGTQQERNITIHVHDLGKEGVILKYSLAEASLSSVQGDNPNSFGKYKIDFSYTLSKQEQDKTWTVASDCAIVYQR